MVVLDSEQHEIISIVFMFGLRNNKQRNNKARWAGLGTQLQPNLIIGLHAGQFGLHNVHVYILLQRVKHQVVREQQDSIDGQLTPLQ